jgi:hypothetical protein
LGCARSDFALLAPVRPPTKIPDTASHHLLVERVDIAGHCFGLDGRVVIVGMVNSNQILRHNFSILP